MLLSFSMSLQTEGCVPRYLPEALRDALFWTFFRGVPLDKPRRILKYHEASQWHLDRQIGSSKPLVRKVQCHKVACKGSYIERAAE